MSACWEEMSDVVAGRPAAETAGDRGADLRRKGLQRRRPSARSAAAPGINIAAVNYYFRDKEHLYIEAVKGPACGSWKRRPCRPGRRTRRRPSSCATSSRVMVGRLMSPDKPAWHARLMVRELTEPTTACAEWVEEYVRPHAQVLKDVLAEVLPPGTSDLQRYLTGFSIMGQCLFYMHCKPVVQLLLGDDHAGITPQLVADHVAEFSLAALGLKAPPRKAKRGAERGDAVNWIALKMLTGNRAKYYAIIFGISFACMLMTQQSSIFVGLMRNTSSQIRDIQGGRHLGHGPQRAVHRRRHAADGERPVPRARRAGRRSGPSCCSRAWRRAQFQSGNFKKFSVIGIDDQTLVGAPAEMLDRLDRRPAAARRRDPRRARLPVPVPRRTAAGRLDGRDERPPRAGRRHLQELAELPDLPGRLYPYSRAIFFAPQERRFLSFILARASRACRWRKCATAFSSRPA